MQRTFFAIATDRTNKGSVSFARAMDTSDEKTCAHCNRTMDTVYGSDPGTGYPDLLGHRCTNLNCDISYEEAEGPWDRDYYMHPEHLSSSEESW